MSPHADIGLATAGSITGPDTPAHVERGLLDAVASLAPLISTHAPRSAVDGRLSDEVTTALRAAGLWRMRLPADLGGLEVSTRTQIRVIAALAAVDPATAWCTMVVNNGTARIGALLPEAAVARVFASGVPACTVVVPPGGVATLVDGGYRLTGTWRFASAVRNADWVQVTALVDRDPSRQIDLVVPAGELTVLDTWDTTGLRATGSHDVALEDHVVPAELAGTPGTARPQIRGTRRHDLVSLDIPESYEHLGFATGVARGVLDELHDYLASPESGSRADREQIQTELGLAEVQLRAVQALTEQVYTAYDRATLGDTAAWPEEDRGLPRALATWATRLALGWCRLAQEKSGLTTLRTGSRVATLLADMTVAAAHMAVDPRALARLAEQRVEDRIMFDPTEGVAR